MRALGVLLATVGFSWADVIIDTTPVWDGSRAVASFGEPFTATFGQTFLAPVTDPVLNQLTFFLDDFLAGVNVDHVTFRASVMTWSDARAGQVLWLSEPVSTTNNAGVGGFEPFVFDTGGVPLAPGLLHVLVMTASYDFDGATGRALVGLVSDFYAGGEFVFVESFDDPSVLSTVDWSSFPAEDLVFTAKFGPIPEPGSLPLFGVAVIVCSLYWRRKVRASGRV